MGHRHVYKLVRETKTKALNISTSLILVAMSLGGALPAVLAQKAFAAGTTTVTPSSLQGWMAVDDNGHGGNLSYVSGPAGSTGTGSAQLSTTNSSQGYMLYKVGYGGTKLADLSNLSYDTYIQQGNNTIAPSMQLNIDKNVTDGDASWQGRLVYEPYMNSAVHDGQWQSWNAANGKWWLTSPAKFDNNCGQANPCTFAQLTALYPNIGINSGLYAGVGFKAGSSWSVPFVGNVDNFSIASDTYDFEPSPLLGAENFNTVDDSSYTGVSVGFNAKDFGTVSNVTVDMTRADGSHAVKHGTQDLFDLISADTSPYQFTAPFVIAAGSYNPTSDSFWTSDPATWTASTTPTSVTITVTGSNGTSSVTNSNFSQGSPSWPAYNNMVPTAAPTGLKFNYTDTNGPDNAGTLACGAYVNSNKPMAWHQNGSLNLNWTAPVGNVTGYQILVTYPDHSSAIAYQGSNPWSWLQFTKGQGTYNYQVRSNGPGGLSAYSTSCDITYDTSKPTVDVNAPTNASDVNSSTSVSVTAHDNINLNRVTVSIRDAANNLVRSSSPFVSGTDYTLTVPLSGLPEGNYSLKTNATDKAGNMSTTVSRAFTIDNTVPTAQITSPSANQVVRGHTLTIKGSATDNTDFNYFYCYVTLPGSSEVGTRGADCNTTWHSVTNGTLGTVDLTGLADGNYEAHLVAYDKAGNHSDFNYAVPFVLDNTRPNITFVTPSDFNSTTYNKYLQSGPNFQVKATDTNGITSTTLHIYNADGSHSTAWCGAATPGDTTTCDASGLADGEYYVKAGTTDVAGNNQTVTKYFTVDSTRPNAHITSPSNNSYHKTGDFTIEGTATDSLSGVDHVNIYVAKLTTGGGFGGYVVNNQAATFNSVTGAFSYSVSGLADGTYTIKANAYDKAGNNHFGNTVTVIVDHVAPTATINASTGTDTTPAITGTVDDPSATLKLAIDGGTANPVVNHGSTWTYDVTSPLSVGTHSLTLVASDNAGNQYQTTGSVVVSAPASPAGTTGGSTPTSTQTATPTSTRTVSSVTVTPSNDGQVLGASTTTPSTVSTTNSSDVKGDSTTKHKSDNSKDGNSSNFLGLGWWWLLVIAVLAFLWWLLVARRRSAEN